MAIEQINLGTVVQDGADGDVARVAFTKINANFADLESRKVEKVAGKQLSTEDYTSAEKMKLAGIESGAQVNTVTSVAGKTGAVALVKGDVGLGNVDNTSDANKPVSTATQTALDLKANASTQIIAGTGLTGGDTLDTNRTLTVSYGTTVGTAAQGNDSRLSDAREWTAETVSQALAEAGTATTRQAWTAQRVRQAIVAWWNGVSSGWGRSFVASANASAGRTALGLGNAATRAVQTSPTDTTAGALMAVGAGGWMGRSGAESYIAGFPQDVVDNISQVYRRESLDNGVAPYSASIHFAAYYTWGRVRISYNTPKAWVQGGVSDDGELGGQQSCTTPSTSSAQYPSMAVFRLGLLLSVAVMRTVDIQNTQMALYLWTIVGMLSQQTQSSPSAQ